VASTVLKCASGSPVVTRGGLKIITHPVPEQWHAPRQPKKKRPKVRARKKTTKKPVQKKKWKQSLIEPRPEGSVVMQHEMHNPAPFRSRLVEDAAEP